MNIRGEQNGSQLVITVNFDTVNQSEIFNKLFIECLQKMAEEDGGELINVKGDKVKNLEQAEVDESVDKMIQNFRNWLG